MGDEGKAVGCVPPTALLSVALGQRSRAIFDFHKRQRLTLVGVRRRMVRLHDSPPLQRLARGPASLFSFALRNGSADLRNGDGGRRGRAQVCGIE